MSLKKILSFIGILILLFILLNINISILIQKILNAKIIFLFFALIVLAFIVVLKALKWQLIIKASNIDFSLKECIKGFCAGFFLSMLTPARIGDIARGLYLKEKKHSIAGITTVVFDRLIDVTLLALFSIIALILFSFYFKVIVLRIEIIIIFLISFFFLLWLFFKKHYMKLILKPFFNILIPEDLKEKTRNNFEKFYESVAETKKQKRILIQAILVGILIWFFTIILAIIVSFSLNLMLPLEAMFLIIPIVSLLDILPISISGIGTREAGFIFLLSFYKIQAETALAFSLLYFFIGYVLLGIIGAYFFLKKPIKIKLRS